jgi:tetratricopeptide (TPR) repeat protein
MRRLSLGLVILAGLSLPAHADSTKSDETGVDRPADGAALLTPAQRRADELDMLFARLYMSDTEEAARALEKRIWALWTTSDSPTAEALLQQASKAMNDGAPREALSILNRLVGTYPNFAEAWNRRATLYYLMKRDTEALLDIQRVLDLEPRHFGALAGRGLIYQRQGKLTAAKQAFEEALKLNPGLEAVKAALKELERQEMGI